MASLSQHFIMFPRPPSQLLAAVDCTALAYCLLLPLEGYDLRGLVGSLWCVPPRMNYQGSRSEVQTQAFQSLFSHPGSIAASTLDLQVCWDLWPCLGVPVGFKTDGTAGGRGKNGLSQDGPSL